MLPLPLPSVIFQRLDDGAVLFAPDTEIYFGLNDVGAKIWELLPPKSDSLTDLCARIAEAYPDADHLMIEQDVTELLSQLLAEGLVTPPTAADTDTLASP
jgi:hypothetical protein